MFPFTKWPAGAVAAGACVLAASLAAAASICTIGIWPPSFHLRSLEVAGAWTHVVVDRPQPLVSDRLATSGDYQTLHKQAVLVGTLMTSRPVIERIASRAGVPATDLAGVTPTTANVPAVLTEPNSERRAADIDAERRPYRLEVQPHSRLPSLALHAQAPTVAEADRLLDAAVPGLQDHLVDLGRARREGRLGSIQVEQVGAPRSSVLNPRARPMIAGVTFVSVLGLAALLALAVRRRRDEAQERSARDVLTTARGGDWPRTGRVLPWMLAALLAMVWLVPFNVVELSVAFPVDLTFDRLVLPAVVCTWLLAMVAGGPAAPKVRLTWIHLAVGAVIATSCLSLVLEAHGLNRTLEYETAVKKVALLVAYASVFVLTASIVRRTEIRAFLVFSLGLATVCALGTIWEYRFAHNVFYSLTDQLLPAAFEVVGTAESAAIDSQGRRVVRGPAELPLEAVAMMTMALPIALVGLLQSGRWRVRLAYALCAALLLAAAVSTYRKSAFVAPASVGLALALYRPREVLRLAPLGAVLGVVIVLLSPGAVHAVASQLSGDRFAAAPTTSDRTSDYDAVRPDVWSHLATGRGYGSYEHTSYRILDMELLRQLVEIGVVGLAAYLAMLLSVVLVARRPIRARGPDAETAMVAAAAAVGFLVASALFDILSFPHTPYLLMFLAALLAVAVTDPRPARGEVRPWSS